MTFTINLLDDTTRPKAPKIEGVTAPQRQHGRRLAMIHAMHLQQMREVRQVLDRVASGLGAAGDVAAAVASLDMTRNIRASGNICGQECQMLTFHHTAEDQCIFPALMGRSEGLTKVVERLAEEHLIIHALIEGLEASAISAIENPSAEAFGELKEIYDLLETVVQSHFGYEQEELEEALGFFEVDV
ncbi:hemerythrin domain-containing protein [Pseudorhizobium marinum]|uniref:hemerythrin domain-containing protein n=1 Tax=Pseudorhizobium marinum TaxID=1496690 RepID=UPI000689CFA0|nr:hemerythrin domain-containing protein [Pseudorhizobium marinum]